MHISKLKFEHFVCVRVLCMCMCVHLWVYECVWWCRRCSTGMCGKLFPFLRNYSSSFLTAVILPSLHIPNYSSWWFRTVMFLISCAKQLHTCNSYTHILHTVETLTKRFTSWMNKFYLGKSRIEFFTWLIDSHGCLG